MDYYYYYYYYYYYCYYYYCYCYCYYYYAYQNGLSHAVCLLLGGAVEVRVELQDNSMSLIQDDSDDKGQEKNADKEKAGEEEKKKKNQNISGDAMGLTLVVGEINPNDTFGHIDFLFRHNNPVVVKELEDALNAFGDKADSQDSTGLASQHGQYSSVNALGVSAGKSAFSKRKFDRGNVKITTHTDAAPLPIIKILQDNSQHRPSNNFDDAEQRASEAGVLARALEPGMFMSYHMRSMCELLLIGKNFWLRIFFLFRNFCFVPTTLHCMYEFQKRFMTNGITYT